MAFDSAHWALRSWRFFAFGRAALLLLLCAVFPREARKNCTQKIVKYHAVAGKKRGFGYPLGDVEQRNCVSPTHAIIPTTPKHLKYMSTAMGQSDPGSQTASCGPQPDFARARAYALARL